MLVPPRVMRNIGRRCRMASYVVPEETAGSESSAAVMTSGFRGAAAVVDAGVAVVDALAQAVPASRANETKCLRDTGELRWSVCNLRRLAERLLVVDTNSEREPISP
jgi:hypothetical protein